MATKVDQFWPPNLIVLRAGSRPGRVHGWAHRTVGGRLADAQRTLSGRWQLRRPVQLPRASRYLARSAWSARRPLLSRSICWASAATRTPKPPTPTPPPHPRPSAPARSCAGCRRRPLGSDASSPQRPTDPARPGCPSKACPDRWVITSLPPAADRRPVAMIGDPPVVPDQWHPTGVRILDGMVGQLS